MVDVGAAIGSYLLLGVDDEVAYNWFHNGPGTEFTTDANAGGWRQIGNAYADVIVLVKRGLAESKASWTGAAADGAHGAVSPLQAWVEQTADAAAAAVGAVEAQSTVFSDTKARLSPPVVVPDKPWWNDLWPGATNYDKVMEVKQANSIRNLELVRSYGDSTQSNTDRYPAFDDPVVVATDVSQPARPVTTPDPGIVEWPAPSPRRPATGGDSPPNTGPNPEPKQPTSNPPSVDVRAQSQSAPTVLSGNTGSPVMNSLLPPGQEVPGSRITIGGGPGAGLVGVPGSGGSDESGSGGRMPGGRTREPGGPLSGRDGRPGAGGRVGGVPEREAVTGRVPSGARGGAGDPGGLVPAGGHTAGSEDEEHRNKFGPFGWHDEFWDDLPPVCPAVIGVDQP